MASKKSSKSSKKSSKKPGKAKSKYDFAVIGVSAPVNANWNGSPLTLNPNDNANMPQAPNGSMVFAYQNKATTSSMGQLSLTGGGGAPTFLPAQSLLNQPNILTQNFGGSGGNNLSVTNTSTPGSTNPIWITAVAPGIPGVTTKNLPTDGSAVPLAPAANAQGTALPRYMQIIMQATSGSLTIFALIGGPMDSGGNNAYVISLNDSANGNTGPGTGKTPPPGYFATTTASSYPYSFNWGSSNVFVANMSPATSATASVFLRAL